MTWEKQLRLNEVIEDDLRHRHDICDVTERLRELGYSSFVEPYITWRKWDSHRESVNRWRRWKHRAKAFVTVRPLPLFVLTVLVVLAFRMGAIGTVFTGIQGALRTWVTPTALTVIAGLLLALIATALLLRPALRAWELRNSTDVRLLTDSFTTDDGVEVATPDCLYRQMTLGGGSRVARMEYSIRLFTIFPARTTLTRQDRLDLASRTKAVARLRQEHMRRYTERGGKDR